MPAPPSGPGIELNGGVRAAFRKEGDKRGEACDEGVIWDGRTRIWGMERGGWEVNVIWRWSGVDSIRSIGEEMNWKLSSDLHMHRMSLPFGSENPNNTL